MSGVGIARKGIVPGHPGERITLLRNRQGLQKQELATLAGVRINTLTNMEQGKTFAYATLEKIALALGVSVADLLTPID